jgi:aspartate kinase
MSRVVVKFGGATLANGGRVKKAAQLVVEAPYEQKVVVVSAPGRTTDQLLNLVSAFEESIEEKAYAEILSMGERTSTKVFTSALRAMGIKAVEFDPSQEGFPVVTNGNFLNATVDLKATRAACRKSVLPLLGEWVIVVPGFLGRCEGRTTVLGRGGSDVTATVLGNCLEADDVILVKDTSGIMSADPEVVPDAKPVSTITIDEMYALAHGGAKVVRPEALYYKADSQRLRVVPFGKPLSDDGTEITGSIDPAYPYFAKGSGLDEVTVVADTGVAVLGNVLQRIGAKVKGVGTGRTTITFFLDGDGWQEVCKRVHGVSGVKAVSGRTGIGYIEVIHPHLVDQPGVVAKAATILSLHGINIVEVTSSKGALTFFLDEKSLDEAYGLLEENLIVGQLDSDKA